MKKFDILLQQIQQASYETAKLSAQQKKQVLGALATCLKEHEKEIIAANQRDILTTKKKGATDAFIDRLTLNEECFAGMIEQLETVARLDDPVGEVIEQRTLKNKIMLKKVRFPLGVVLMIYESRPNVTVDVAGLCLKSGNTVILKGGNEAQHTNKALVSCIHQTLRKYAIAESAVIFLDQATHADIETLLQRDDIIAVVIPRGSYALTTAVAKKSRIPILYHASGGARMYVDVSADIKQALEICLNAKTDRTGVCNALDCVLVHQDIAAVFLPLLDEKLTEKGFVIRADRQAMRSMKHATFATTQDFSTEFLDKILAVKVVATGGEAIQFIQKHTHGHTEVIAAKNKEVIDTFITTVDAAGIMVNCSSRLHDGGEFGMGAEMGTATGKLHARGPVGVRELTTYKWIAYGNGQLKNER